ncbi:MAG: alpha/beta hydrolase [Selenomonadaceae bacterium]
MKKTFFIIISTALITCIITAAALTGFAAYAVGSFFVDAALKRGSINDADAPPAIFRSAFEGNGKPIVAAERPKYESDEWAMRSYDGLMLCATHFSPADDDTHRWAIVVHGYGLSQAYAWNYASAFLEHGYHVLTPDMRASGKSGGTYLTMGAKESIDVSDWASEITRRDPDAKIVLFGVSMGAATVMLAGADDGLPRSVTAVIEDSGYTDLRSVFAEELDKLIGLPPFPFLEFIDFVAQKRAGFTFEEAQPIKAVKKSRLPMLFIHGDADQLIPYAMMRRLYDASSSSDKETFTAEKMPHAAAYQKKGYYKKVFDFADRHTK